MFLASAAGRTPSTTASIIGTSLTGRTEPELAGNDARDVEQIVNELRLGPGTAHDGLNCTF